MRLLVLLILLPIIAIGQNAKEVQWSGDETSFGEIVVIDDEGNFIMAYNYLGAIGQPLESAVVKFDSDFQQIWGKRFSSDRTITITDLLIGESGSLVISGELSFAFPGNPETAETDAFIMTLNDEGSLIWQSCYAGIPSDDVIGSVLSDDGSIQLFLQTFFDPFEYRSNVIQVSQSGNTLNAIEISLDQGQLRLLNTLELDDETYLTLGAISIQSSFVPFLASHTLQEVNWVKSFSHPDLLNPQGFSRKANGNILVYGNNIDIDNNQNFYEQGFLIEFNSTGQLVRTKQLILSNDSNSSAIFSAYPEQNGNVVIATSEGPFEERVFKLSRLDEQLEVIWSKRHSNPDFAFLNPEGIEMNEKTLVSGLNIENQAMFINEVPLSGELDCNLVETNFEWQDYEGITTSDFEGQISFVQSELPEVSSIITVSEFSLQEIDFCSQTLSTDELENRGIIAISPNPASSSFAVRNMERIEFLEILGSDGKLIKRIEDILNSQRIDVSNLKQGIYLIKIYSEGKLYVERLVKM